jgi:hypothetical protein
MKVMNSFFISWFDHKVLHYIWKEKVYISLMRFGFVL